MSQHHDSHVHFWLHTRTVRHCPNYMKQGELLTIEGRILGALIDRLGGKVTVNIEELRAVEGVSIHPQNNCDEYIVTARLKQIDITDELRQKCRQSLGNVPL